MEANIYNGIFNDENGQRFVRFLANLTQKAFGDVHERCIQTNSDKRMYRKALERVPTWSNQVFETDLNAILQEWPDITSAYNTCFIQYKVCTWGQLQNS